MGIGYEFQPGDDERLRKRIQAGVSPNSSQALQILSLRLPNVLGGRPIAPDDLLTSRVGGAAPGSSVVDTIMKATGADPTSSPDYSNTYMPASSPAGGTSESAQLAALIAGALSSSPAPKLEFGDQPRTVTPEQTPDRAGAEPPPAPPEPDRAGTPPPTSTEADRAGTAPPSGDSGGSSSEPVGSLMDTLFGRRRDRSY